MLVVVDDLPESEQKLVFRLSYDVGIKGDAFVILSQLAYATARIADIRVRVKRCVREIALDGMPL